MAKTLTLRVDEETYRKLAEAAEAEGRSIANLIETAAVEHLRDQQFVDDAEMAEIEANERLVARLKRGSRDAHARRGRFVG
jgi:predicted transcriptional regulator